MKYLHEVDVEKQFQELSTRPLAVSAVLAGVEDPGGQFGRVAEDGQEERPERLLPPVGDDSLPDGRQVGGQPALDGRGGQGGLGGGGGELAQEGGQASPYLGREEGGEGGLSREEGLRGEDCEEREDCEEG